MLKLGIQEEKEKTFNSKHRIQNKKAVFYNNRHNTGFINFVKNNGTYITHKVYEEKAVLKFINKHSNLLVDIDDRKENDDNDSSDSVVNIDIRRAFEFNFFDDIKDSLKYKKINQHKFQQLIKLNRYNETLFKDYRQALRRSQSVR